MHAASDTGVPGARRRPWRWAIVATLAAVPVALLLFLYFRRPAGDHHPNPDPPASPFRNTRPGVAFVGSEACRPCHADEHTSFRHTGMGRSMAESDPKQMPPD